MSDLDLEIAKTIRELMAKAIARIKQGQGTDDLRQLRPVPK